jgi:hypothetical protein
LTGSYGRLAYIAGFTAWLLDARMTVWPSGAALATICVPMIVPAPGLLSTTTGCAQASESLSASVRAIGSTAPPGG